MVNLPFVAQRAVFTGNGFPFREDDFLEYNKRKFLIFGSPEDWIRLGKSLNGVKTRIIYQSLIWNRGWYSRLKFIKRTVFLVVD